MTPEEDITWPDCWEHPDDNSPGAQCAHHWCDWTRRYFLDGADAENVRPGLRFCIPIVPSLDLYAEVSIDTEVIGESAMLYLVMFTDLFSMQEDLIPLGMWTVGEGRRVMSLVVDDWCEGYADPKCEASSHSFEQEMSVQQIEQQADPGMLKANKWCLAYHKSCYPCWWKNSQKTATTQTTWSASSFGLNPDQFNTGRGTNVNSTSGSFTSTSAQQRARDTLQVRYGQQRARRIMTGVEACPLGDNSYLTPGVFDGGC